MTVPDAQQPRSADDEQLAALRQRLAGRRPAGLWNLGTWGLLVNVLALDYGLFVARPDRHSDGVPEDDAIEVARHLRQIRESHRPAVPGPRSPAVPATRPPAVPITRPPAENAAAPREEIR